MPLGQVVDCEVLQAFVFGPSECVQKHRVASVYMLTHRHTNTHTYTRTHVRTHTHTHTHTLVLCPEDTPLLGHSSKPIQPKHPSGNMLTRPLMPARTERQLGATCGSYLWTVLMDDHNMQAEATEKGGRRNILSFID